MTQVFRVELDGVDITDDVGNTSISLTMNRFYNVAKFDFGISDALWTIGKEISIFYGDSTFVGFVYKADKNSYATFTIECRTNSAKLTEPFSPSEEKTESATTAISLCALYALETGISITYNSEDIDFGGSYERSGTMLSALSNVASITGAEYYDNGSGVVIEPNKPVSSVGGVIVNENEYFDYEQSSLSLFNNGIGTITIQNATDSVNNIVASNGIYIEVDETDGTAFIYSTPTGNIESASGISIYGDITTILRTETIDVNDSVSVETDGAISSIEEVTLNGVVISNYDFTDGYNLIYFLNEQRGTVTIKYYAYVEMGTVNTSVTPMGNFFAINLRYLDQELAMQGFILDSNETNYGDNIIVITDKLNPVIGYDFYVQGGEADVDIYFNGSVYPANWVGVPDVYTKSEELNLSPVGDGTYKACTSLPPTTFLYATSFGAEIQYTTIVDGDNTCFLFDRYYPRVVGTYSLDVLKFTIQTPAIAEVEGAMTVTDVASGKVFEYDLEMPDENDITTLPCALNQNIPIDIAGDLGKELEEVRGKTVVVTNPALVSENKVVQPDGFIKIYVTMNGLYSVDTSSISSRNTYSTVLVNVPQGN